MNLSRNTHLRCLWTLGLAISLALMSGCKSHEVRMPPGSPTPPTNYEYDVFSQWPSTNCATSTDSTGTKHQQYLVVPRAQSSDNRYVLLLAFDTPDHSDNAGQKLFSADPRDPTRQITAGCFPDPDMGKITSKVVDTANPFVLLVQGGRGGCPDDCTSQLPDGTFAFRRNSGAQSPDPDPLSKTGMYWGTFFGNSDPRPGCDTDTKPTSSSGTTYCHDSAVRFWQIRVRNVAHAQDILATLQGMGLTVGGTTYPGYVGHLVIGYRYSGRDTD
jgi:hypothetical protein